MYSIVVASTTFCCTRAVSKLPHREAGGVLKLVAKRSRAAAKRRTEATKSSHHDAGEAVGVVQDRRRRSRFTLQAVKWC